MKCEFYERPFQKCIATGTAVAIGAGVSAASAAGQIASAGKMNQKGIRENRRMREWQEKVMKQQREWALADWNMQNEYNSPAAQVQRYKDAGLSPTAFLQNPDVGTAQGVAGSEIPTGSTPDLFNPMAGATPHLQQVGDSFLEYLKLKNETQHALNETNKTENDIEYQNNKKRIETELAKGQLSLWGVQCNVGREGILKSKKEREALAASIAKTYQDVEQSKAYIDWLGVQKDYTTWQKYCQQRKLPHEIEVLGAHAMLLKAQKAESWRKQRLLDIQRDRETLYNDKYMKVNMYNDYLRQYYATKQAEGGTYSDTGYSVLRGLRLTGETLGVVGQAIRGYGMFMQGRSIQQNMMRLRSSSNPSKSRSRYMQEHDFTSDFLNSSADTGFNNF